LETNQAQLLKVDGLVAGYGETTVLHGTTFTVPAQAITTMIGPNGAGKSTVFKTLFGLLPLREGSVAFNDQDVTGFKPIKLLQLGMAYMPQGRNIFPELSVQHNLELGGVGLGDLSETRRRMERVMERFPALRQKAAAQASTLSGGEQKMLEIGRALLLDPKLLLIDEPSMGLAPRLTAEVFDLLLTLKDSGVTILMVEQNARQALTISDYGLVLQQGHLVLSGTATEVLNHPEIGRLFLGGTVSVNS
jgi:branched-chain amino acid transport system ATP-binding protein